MDDKMMAVNVLVPLVQDLPIVQIDSRTVDAWSRYCGQLFGEILQVIVNARLTSFNGGELRVVC